MSKKLQAHVAVLFANILFAINYITIKHIVPAKLGAPALNICRVAGCVILFWCLYFINPSKPGIEKKDIPRFFLCSVAGIFLNQVLFVKGLSLTSAIHASLLALVTPILIIFIAAWILKEKLTWLKVIGLVTGVSGAIILILMKDASHTASNIVLGDVFVILNAIAYAFYFVLVKPLMLKYSPVHVLRWIFTIGLLFMLPYGFASLKATEWQQFENFDWFCFVFVITGATFLAYLFNIFGVAVIGASATGSYIYTQPVFTALIAIIFIGEKYDWLKFIASVLIFSGVYLVNYKSKVS